MKTPKQKKPAKEKTEPESKIVVGVEIMAEAFNLTPRRVQQLAKEGILETEGTRGKYDLVKNTRNYIRHLQESFKRPEAVTNLQSEVLKAKQMDNQDREILLAARRSEFMPTVLLENILDEVISTSKAAIETAGKNLENDARKESLKAAKKINDGFRELLVELGSLNASSLIAEAQTEALSSTGKHNLLPMVREISEA